MSLRVLYLCIAVLFSAKGFGANLIQIENSRLGNSDWELKDPATKREIEGYASLTSADRGEEIQFFVSTQDLLFQAEVYRMGWYGGLGARKMKTFRGLKGQQQTMPQMDPHTGLLECDWSLSFSLKIPNDEPQEWVSGHYLVKLTGSSGKQSYVHFVVRDDERPTAVVVNASVTTWQAYNNWPGQQQGGKSVYVHSSSDQVKAQKVSFNRPYALGDNPLSAPGVGAGEFLTNSQPSEETHPSGWEYAFVRFIERHGQDVKYITNLDLHRDTQILNSTPLLFSVGHDEYYSWEMRRRVTEHHNQGGHVGVIGSNAIYWQIRMEPSAQGQPTRTMVVYKNRDYDPLGDSHLATVQWRVPPVKMPEQNLIGVQYMEDPADPIHPGDGLVLNIDQTHWLLKGTGVQKGHVLRGAIGYEADRIFGDKPDNVELIGQAEYYNRRDKIFGTSHMVLKTNLNHGVVLSTGTMNIINLLDSYGLRWHRTPVDPIAQKLVLNFAGLAQQSSKSTVAPQGLKTSFASPCNEIL